VQLPGSPVVAAIIQENFSGRATALPVAMPVVTMKTQMESNPGIPDMIPLQAKPIMRLKT